MHAFEFEIDVQPDDVSCGPTCLHAIYRYFGDDISLHQVIAEVDQLSNGGTLDVFLANHALRRGYKASLYTYNLRVFDPTWANLPPETVIERLEAQAAAKPRPQLRALTGGYVDFLRLGGNLRWEDLTANLLRRYLKRSIPIMTGLSATYLYRIIREIPETNVDDDVRGEPAGHFVVLSGYQKSARTVKVADPYRKNPFSGTNYYDVDVPRLIASILLGIVTYDSNLLIIEPGNS